MEPKTALTIKLTCRCGETIVAKIPKDNSNTRYIVPCSCGRQYSMYKDTLYNPEGIALGKTKLYTASGTSTVQ